MRQAFASVYLPLPLGGPKEYLVRRMARLQQEGKIRLIGLFEYHGQIVRKGAVNCRDRLGAEPLQRR
jgi:hypothetical protein